VLKRLLQFVPVFFGVTALVFFLMRLAPGDTAYILLRDRGLDVSSEAVAETRHELGLDLPPALQYGRWLSSVLRLRLGNSLITGEDVAPELLRHFRMTLLLTLPSLTLVLIFAFPLGALSAVYKGRLWDSLTRLGAIACMSIPAFCVGLLLILIFSVRLKWLPSFGAGGLPHLLMPCFVLSLGPAAHYTRLIRSALLEELSAEYVRAARSRGIGPFTILVFHAMKNALVPILTALGMSFALMLGGQAVVEKLFSWPGLGKYLIDAILARDYPVVQGCALFYAFLFAALNLAADIVCMGIDPAVRKRSVKP
jgi:peptide/nickel transport system permease protein